MKLETLKKGFTLVEIMVVIAIIAALAGMSTVGALKGKKKGTEVGARALMMELSLAIESFYDEYGYLPEGKNEGVSFSGPNDPTSASLNASEGVFYTDADFMATLIGLDEEQNPDKRAFFESNAFKKGKGGLLYANNSKDSPAALLDPWGNPYVIRLDLDQDGFMPAFNPPVGGGIATDADSLELIRGKRVIIMSFGDDGLNNPFKPRLNQDNRGNIYSF